MLMNTCTYNNIFSLFKTFGIMTTVGVNEWNIMHYETRFEKIGRCFAVLTNKLSCLLLVYTIIIKIKRNTAQF